MMNLIRIGLDVDGVLANFMDAMLIRLKGTEFESLFPETWSAWTKYDGHDHDLFQRAFSLMQDDPKFWLDIKPFDNSTFGFTPAAYITKRPVPSCITQAWMHINGFPLSQVCTVDRTDAKVHAFSLCDLDLFVEDYHETAIMMNKAGCRTVLINRPWNVNEVTPGVERIDSLGELDQLVLPQLKAA